MMKLNKKGDGLSLTTVVIAAIALIVLIILILIFSGRISIFNTGVSECPAKSGKYSVVAEDDPCNSNKLYGTLPVKVIDNKDTGQLMYCCKQVYSACSSAPEGGCADGTTSVSGECCTPATS